MAWLNTDWGSELEQVETKVISVLEEKIEPLTERVILKASAEMSNLVSKASFEMQDAGQLMLREIAAQRKELVEDLRALIRYAGFIAFMVILSSVAVIRIVDAI